MIGVTMSRPRVMQWVSPPTQEAFLCAVLAAAASSVAVLVVPAGGDLAAHLYRTDLVQHGLVVWDNLWFSGQYPLASYSLFYYPLAAVVGNSVLGIAGVGVSALLFALLVDREWHAAGRWPARAFAVLAAGQAFTAAYPYDVGVATLLGALWALQRRRLAIASVCTVLTVGFSPLAFVFLVLAAAALFVRRFRVDRRALMTAAAIGAAAALELTVLVVFPSTNLVYPYGTWRLVGGLAVVALGIALSFAGRAGWRLASLFVVWGAASIGAYLIPSPIGHNLVRASVFLVPLMLVAAKLADYRPRWLAAAAIAGALAANLLPYVPMIPQRSVDGGARAAYWQPLIGFLHRRLEADYRVEVVPTANHWETYFLPAAGIPLARGWYRQLDIAQNPGLYVRRLTPAGYRSWLRADAVRFVVVAHLPLGTGDALREARLVEARGSGLRRVFADASGAIYELPHATPLLTGPGRSTISSFTADTVDGWTARPGTFQLRVHYNPYWLTNAGDVCVEPFRGITRLTVVRAGRFRLRAIESPLDAIGRRLDGDRSSACAAATRGQSIARR